MKLEQYQKRKKIVKTIKISGVILLAAFIASYPYIKNQNIDFNPFYSKSIDALAQTALFSAGLTMPEGGIKAVQANIDSITLLSGDKAFLNVKQMSSGETLVAFFKSENEEDEGYSDNDIEENVVENSSSPQQNEDQPKTDNTQTVQNLLLRQNISDFKTEVDYKAEGKKSGKIISQNFSSEESNSILKLEKGGFLRNATDHTLNDIKKVVSQKPDIKIEKNKDPQVLIMHTHATEGYEPYTRDYFDVDFYDRTRDSSKNVVAVGYEIAKQLESAGISVIQDGTLHDYPSYTGSYSRSEKTVQEILKKYPSIKVVIDVHRDAIIKTDGSRIAPTAEINGKKAAQVMIISGCDDGTFNMPNYFENLKLASMLQQEMESSYPGLTRAILFDYRKYNQHLTTGSLLVEVGSHANSLEQAVYSGELVGKALASTLSQLST